MKKLIFSLLFICACSDNNISSPGWTVVSSPDVYSCAIEECGQYPTKKICDDAGQFNIIRCVFAPNFGCKWICCAGD